MATTTASHGVAQHDSGHENYLTAGKGIMSWLGTLDHKRIGIMYLLCILGAFLIGGIFALLVRTELLTQGKTLVDPDQYNQFFTLHGAIMVFMFIIPGIPAALGNFVLPLMLGAKDVAFPRLNLTSWYLWIGGSALMVGAILTGGLDTGWTFYTPYSTVTGTKVIMAGMGVFTLGFSSIFTGLNFIVTIHKLRPKGHDVVQDAALPVGDVLHRRSSRCWPRRSSASRCLLLDGRARDGHRHLRSRAGR